MWCALGLHLAVPPTMPVAHKSSHPGRVSRPHRLTERGIALLDALVATTIVVTTLTGVAQLLIWSRRAVWSSGAESTSVLLAAQKLEQLRTLVWQVDRDGRPRSDHATNLSTDPPSTGGSGLRASPPASLDENTPGFVDYVDGRGAWAGTGTRPPGSAVFVRRWAIVPFEPDPLHTVVVHVVVMPVLDAAVSGGHRSKRAAHLSSIRTRSLP
jgi:hypothetical protein